jgi:hypothetical protein
MQPPEQRAPATRCSAPLIHAYRAFLSQVVPRVSPVIQFGQFGSKKASNKLAFAYGLPGNYNAFGGGELNFDPAGFLEGKSELEVNRYREAELTHGRVGMLASAGFIVQ